MQPSSRGDAGNAEAGPCPRDISAVGRNSAIFWKDHRKFSGSCQFVMSTTVGAESKLVLSTDVSFQCRTSAADDGHLMWFSISAMMQLLSAAPRQRRLCGHYHWVFTPIPAVASTGSVALNGSPVNPARTLSMKCLALMLSCVEPLRST